MFTSVCYYLHFYYLSGWWNGISYLENTGECLYFLIVNASVIFADYPAVDVNNIGKGKGGGSCTAAAFLKVNL